jgi:hypothetical protein
MQNIVAL